MTQFVYSNQTMSKRMQKIATWLEEMGYAFAGTAEKQDVALLHKVYCVVNTATEAMYFAKTQDELELLVEYLWQRREGMISQEVYFVDVLLGSAMLLQSLKSYTSPRSGIVAKFVERQAEKPVQEGEVYPTVETVSTDDGQEGEVYPTLEECITLFETVSTDDSEMGQAASEVVMVLRYAKEAICLNRCTVSQGLDLAIKRVTVSSERSEGIASVVFHVAIETLKLAKKGLHWKHRSSRVRDRLYEAIAQSEDETVKECYRIALWPFFALPNERSVDDAVCTLQSHLDSVVHVKEHNREAQRRKIDALCDAMDIVAYAWA